METDSAIMQDDVAYVGVCSVGTAKNLEITQLSASGCGVTAVVNVLVLADCTDNINSLALDSCILRRRKNDAYVAEYLASRSVAGCTGQDLVTSMNSVYIDNHSILGSCSRFDSKFMSYEEITNSCSLFDFIVDSLASRKYLVGTLNLQVVGNDAWHHQVIFGADVKQRLVYCMNPLCAYTEQELVTYMSTPSVLLIRRSDVISRIPPPDCITNEDIYDSPDWVRYCVRQNIEAMTGDTSMQYLVIPASYVGGIAVFTSVSAAGEVTEVEESAVDVSRNSDKSESDVLPDTVFALFGGDSTDVQSRYQIPGQQDHIVVHTRRSKDRVFVSSDPQPDKLFADDIWPGCKAIADYLAFHPETIAGKSVLELGAGAALPSLLCAKLGASFVCSTDYPEEDILANMVMLCKENAIPVCRLASEPVRMDTGSVAVAGLEWGNRAQMDVITSCLVPSGFDVIICAELLWKDTYSLHSALVETICKLMSKEGRTFFSFAHRPTAGHSPDSDLEIFEVARNIPYNLHLQHVTTCCKYKDVGEDECIEVNIYMLSFEHF